MYELITDKTLAEYEAFLAGHPKGHFAQSSLWGNKNPPGPGVRWRSGGRTERSGGLWHFSFGKMPVFGASMLYACRGPVCDLDDRETLLP